jgi:hypothetical protein
LTIYEQLIEVLNERKDDILTSIEIKDRLIAMFNTNPNSIILSDYCYNRYNNGISFNKHLFIYITRSTYRYVGENYSYTGLIYHKPKGGDYESVVGEWDQGLTFQQLLERVDLPKTTIHRFLKAFVKSGLIDLNR